MLGNALTCFLDPGSSGEVNTHASARRGHRSCNLCLAALALNPNAVVFLEQSGKGAFISDPLPLHSCIWDVFPSDLFLSCSFTSFRSIFKCHRLRDLSWLPNKTHLSTLLTLLLFLHRACNHHRVLRVSVPCSTPSLTGACLPATTCPEPREAPSTQQVRCDG